MSDETNKVEGTREPAGLAPEDGEIPDDLQDPPTEESQASSKNEAKLRTYGSGSTSSSRPDNAASRQAENEFILLEDVDSGKPSPSGSLEGETGQEENVIGIEDDMEHGDEEYEEEEYEEDLSAEQRDIHEVVNEVLDTKLESFQAQIQKMFTMMQGSIEGTTGKGATAGGAEGPDESVGEPDDDCPVQSGRGEDDEAAEQRLSKHQQKEWKDFLGRVSSILDLECTSVTHASVLDETVGSAEKVTEYLPAEGVVKNSWGKVEGKLLKEVKQQCYKLNSQQDYHWPAEDMESYGNITYANKDLIDYLRSVVGGSKPYGLQGISKGLQIDLGGIEGLFRYQQRIMSYASYFTAALGKLLSAEQLVEEDKIEEVLRNLDQCLVDASDTNVNGCVLTTRSSRRLYMDALQVTEGSNPACNVLNLPIVRKLFPSPELNQVLLNFGINLEEPHLSKGRFAGRGSFGHRGRPTRRSSRGFIPRGRGAHPRGRPSPARGVMRCRGGPSGRGNYDQERESSTQGPSRGGNTPPRGRGGYQRGRGTRGTRARGWQPRNRGRGRGRPDRGLKRNSHDDNTFAEKHRRVDRIPTVDPSYSSQYERRTSPLRRRSFSPQKRDRGVDYQSIPDDPSSYYRSPSVRELSPRSGHNEGWY